jgi:hypothetical protein
METRDPWAEARPQSTAGLGMFSLFHWGRPEQMLLFGCPGRAAFPSLSPDVLQPPGTSLVRTRKLIQPRARPPRGYQGQGQSQSHVLAVANLRTFKSQDWKDPPRLSILRALQTRSRGSEWETCIPKVTQQGPGRHR